MNTKNGSPIFHTWGLKSIHQSCNTHTCFPIIASNAFRDASRLTFCGFFIFPFTYVSCLPFTYLDWLLVARVPRKHLGCFYIRVRVKVKAKAIIFFDLLLPTHRCSMNTQIGNSATDWKRCRFRFHFRSNINAPLKWNSTHCMIGYTCNRNICHASSPY